MISGSLALSGALVHEGRLSRHPGRGIFTPFLPRVILYSLSLHSFILPTPSSSPGPRPLAPRLRFFHRSFPFQSALSRRRSFVLFVRLSPLKFAPSSFLFFSPLIFHIFVFLFFTSPLLILFLSFLHCFVTRRSLRCCN